jgi:hypothetical protein
MPGGSAYERQLIEAALEFRESPLEPGTALLLIPEVYDFHQVCNVAVWPALSACGFRPLRGALPFDSGSWLGDVARWLRGAEVIIADVTGRNPDVLYALGLAHGLGRCPLLIAQDPDELPFHLQELRCIGYRSHPYGLWALREELSRALRVFLAAAQAPQEPPS